MIKKAFSRGVVLAAGLLAVAGTSDPRSVSIQEAVEPADSRLQKVKGYFLQRKCPAYRFAADFIAAADEHKLDWRLLPSLSMIESGGAKQFMNNNMFGWDNCKQKFRDLRTGIYVVASRLRNSELYKGKDLDGILRTYNPRSGYAQRVKAVMQQISAHTPEPAAAN